MWRIRIEVWSGLSLVARALLLVMASHPLFSAAGLPLWPEGVFPYLGLSPARGRRALAELAGAGLVICQGDLIRIPCLEDGANAAPKAFLSQPDKGLAARGLKQGAVSGGESCAGLGADIQPCVQEKGTRGRSSRLALAGLAGGLPRPGPTPARRRAARGRMLYIAPLDHAEPSPELLASLERPWEMPQNGPQWLEPALETESSHSHMDGPEILSQGECELVGMYSPEPMGPMAATLPRELLAGPEAADMPARVCGGDFAQDADCYPMHQVWPAPADGRPAGRMDCPLLADGDFMCWPSTPAGFAQCGLVAGGHVPGIAGAGDGVPMDAGKESAGEGGALKGIKNSSSSARALINNNININYSLSSSAKNAPGEYGVFCARTDSSSSSSSSSSSGAAANHGECQPMPDGFTPAHECQASGQPVKLYANGDFKPTFRNSAGFLQGISSATAARWAQAWPGTDIDLELAGIMAWLETHPRDRPEPGLVSMEAYVGNCISKKARRLAGHGAGPGGHKKRRPACKAPVPASSLGHKVLGQIAGQASAAG